MLAAIKKNKKAHAAFEAFSPSHQREYIEWITDAKTDETRDRRLETAVRVDGRRQEPELEVRSDDAMPDVRLG